MSDSKCEYSSNGSNDYYRCNMDVWENSENNYCIFHDPKPNKSKEEFKKEFEKQLNNKGANPKYEFRGYYFCEEMTHCFKEVIFKEKVYFKDVTFFGSVNFNNAIFKDDVVFQNVSFEGLVNNFRKTSFDELTRFENVHFENVCDFTDTYFDFVLFNGVTFNKQANFTDSSFHNIDLENINFEKEAIFIRAKFDFKFKLSDANFKEKVQFYNSVFNGQVYFNNVYFYKKAALEGTRFKDRISCINTKFKKPEDEEYLCREARLSWEKIGVREKADNYFKKERRAKRKQLGPEYNNDKLSFNWYKNFKEWNQVFKSVKWKDWKGWFELIIRFFEWVLADLTTSYGTSWKRILIWWGSVILIPALIYSIYDTILINSKIVSINFYQGLYFSIVTFVTLGYGDMIPKNGWPRVLASLESILGAFLVAAFVAVFSRKFMR